VGSEAERQAIRAERSVRHDSSVRVRKENASTHVIPHNPMFRILGRTASQAACLGRSNAANFGTCGMRINSTNKYIKIVLIISDIPTTVQIGIGRFEALQLDADGNELSSQKGPSVASRRTRLKPWLCSCWLRQWKAASESSTRV
jgi:hypothetical protein